MKISTISRPHIVAASTMLFLTITAFSQTSIDRAAIAEKTWPDFWRQFTLAIKNKNQSALLRTMPPDFFDGGGGLTPKQWLKFINENESKGSWRDLQKSMTAGTKTNRVWNSKSVPTKVTRDNAYYFEFRKDGKWYFAGVVGD